MNRTSYQDYLDGLRLPKEIADETLRSMLEQNNRLRQGKKPFRKKGKGAGKLRLLKRFTHSRSSEKDGGGSRPSFRKFSFKAKRKAGRNRKRTEHSES